jgi:hypothetical protein
MYRFFFAQSLSNFLTPFLSLSLSQERKKEKENMGSGYSFSKLSFIEKSQIKSLSTFCPHLVLSLLSRSLRDKIFSKSFSVFGSCLLVDICGFTTYSGNLCKEGVTGIDKLRRTTSYFLSKFIEMIYWYSGDGKKIIEISFYFLFLSSSLYLFLSFSHQPFAANNCRPQVRGFFRTTLSIF